MKSEVGMVLTSLNFENNMRLISKQITETFTVEYSGHIIKVEKQPLKEPNFFRIGGLTQTALHSEDWDQMKADILRFIERG